jgi:hypothetical protein
MVTSIVPEGSSGIYPQNFHGEGKEWHRTQKAAVERACEMVDAKIKSIDKQRAKLLKMRF